MIQVQELTKDYGEVRAVDNITLSVSKGEIVGLLGPNGAGKTTTLRILTGYLKPTGGTVFVKDMDVRQFPIQVKQAIGYLPESAPLYPDMLVYDYLDYVADIRGLTGEDKMKRIIRLAGLCGIEEVMHKPIVTLSRGYNQRVGLAYAMMSDPEILVLDEPTSGLDPNQIVEIRNIIKEIGRKKTVIFSTHILSEAEATCDRVIIINKGKIAADGTTSLLQNMGGAEHTIRVSLLGTNGKEVQSVFSGIAGVKSITQEECPEIIGTMPEHRPESSDAAATTVRVTSNGDVREQVYEMIKSKPWVLLEFTQERKSLEHIFRDLTKESGK